MGVRESKELKVFDLRQGGSAWERCENQFAIMRSRLNRICNWEALADRANYSTKELARLCGGVSVRQLERYFLRQFGASPHKWLRQQKLNRAKQILVEGNSVKEVSGYLNYKDASHFSKDFKVFFGVPPSDWLHSKPLTVPPSRDDAF